MTNTIRKAAKTACPHRLKELMCSGLLPCKTNLYRLRRAVSSKGNLEQVRSSGVVGISIGLQGWGWLRQSAITRRKLSAVATVAPEVVQDTFVPPVTVQAYQVEPADTSLILTVEPFLISVVVEKVTESMFFGLSAFRL